MAVKKKVNYYVDARTDHNSGQIALNEVEILVIGDRCWGKGKTLDDALAVARAHGGAAGVRRYMAYLAHPKTYVEEMTIASPAGNFSPVLFHVKS